MVTYATHTLHISVYMCMYIGINKNIWSPSLNANSLHTNNGKLSKTGTRTERVHICMDRLSAVE
jgi:hypothetical protein